MRVEGVDGQVGAIFRRMELPPDGWREELAEMVEQDEERKTLSDQRARLAAERKCLKKMRIKGVFDDDPEMFDQELARVRRKWKSAIDTREKRPGTGSRDVMRICG